MASQRDPQNLKNLTKSAKFEPRTPFESSFGRFHFRNGFQVVSRDLRNLKNDGFTWVKPSFSEIHSDLKMVSFGHLFGPFWHHFPSHEVPNGAQSGKKDDFKKHQKNYQILRPNLTSKMTSKMACTKLHWGSFLAFRSPFGS